MTISVGFSGLVYGWLPVDANSRLRASVRSLQLRCWRRRARMRCPRATLLEVEPSRRLCTFDITANEPRRERPVA